MEEGSLPFPVICSLLRLGVKYKFVDILEEVMERLTSTFPSTNNDWNSPNRLDLIKMDYHADDYELLRLARSLGIRSVLPRLLYEIVNIADIGATASP